MSDKKESARIPRIGILSPATEPGMRDWWRELILGLREFGYVEGSNIEFVWRFAEGRFERLTDLAAELSQLDVDIVMPATPPAILAAKSVFSATPIVFPLGSDPVETGLVQSLDRPGGNMTGMATMSPLQSGPRIALVRELLPRASRISLMRHTANAALGLQVEASRKAAPEHGFELLVLGFAVADEIEEVFALADKQRSQAMLPLSDPMASSNAGKIAAFSLQYRIPVVSPFRAITEAGGVLSYGPDLSKLFRRSASLVDQILKGAKAGDLPIKGPSEFELAVNPKAAEALGVPIPPSILSRATHVVR